MLATKCCPRWGIIVGQLTEKNTGSVLVQYVYTSHSHCAPTHNHSHYCAPHEHFCTHPTDNLDLIFYTHNLNQKQIPLVSLLWYNQGCWFIHALVQTQMVMLHFQNVTSNSAPRVLQKGTARSVPQKLTRSRQRFAQVSLLKCRWHFFLHSIKHPFLCRVR